MKRLALAAVLLPPHSPITSKPMLSFAQPASIEPDMLEPMARWSVKDVDTMKGVSMRRLLLVGAAACLLATQTANAKGCLEGAAIGGAVGHMTHHTFLGLFGGCAGGLYVHHLYSKWKRNHPNGTMNEFVSDNKEYLPAGWADRLTTSQRWVTQTYVQVPPVKTNSNRYLCLGFFEAHSF